MPTILIVDDHARVRRVLRTFIEQNTDWTVCGEAEDGRSAVEQALLLRPTAVLLDLTMPRMNGVDAAREIRKLLPSTAMLMLTMDSSDEFHHKVKAVGIQKIMEKTNGLRELGPALNELATTVS